MNYRGQQVLCSSISKKLLLQYFFLFYPKGTKHSSFQTEGNLEPETTNIFKVPIIFPYTLLKKLPLIIYIGLLMEPVNSK